MNSMRLFSILFLLASFIAPVANAAHYVSAEVGVVDTTLSYGYADSHKTTLVGRVATGYLWENPVNDRWQYGFEIGFENFNKVNKHFQDIDVKYHQFQVDALGVVDYSLSEKVDFFAKLGLAYAKRKLSAESETSFIFSQYNGVFHDGFAKGVVGVGYNLTEHVNLNVSMENNFGYHHPTRNLLAGIKYTF